MRTTRSSAIDLVAVVAALALAAPGSARAQEDHEHDDPEAVRHLGHDHEHGDFPEYVDVFFTHHAYLERKLHPRVQSTIADQESEYEASVELAWQFNDRLGGEVEIPYVVTDPETGDSVSGFGDLEIAPIVAFIQDPERLLIVSGRSGFVLPTGDEDDGLGIDGWGWESGLLLWKGLGAEKRGALQGELTYDRLFADERPDEEELVYNLALSWWLPSNFIPIAEINGVTPIGDEPEAGDPEEEEEDHGSLAPAHGEARGGEDTVISGTLGFRYAFANGQQWGAGLQAPMRGGDAFDVRLVVGGIIHLD